MFTADYIYYTRKKQELIIRHFHKGDLQLVDTKNIYSLIQDGYTNEPEEIFYQNGKFFLFSKLYSERDKTELLALEVFNELCERTSVAILDTLTTDEMNYIEASNSKDGFILAKHLRFTQMVEQEINLLKIDSNGEIEWRKEISSPMALQNLRIEQIRYSKDDPIYVLCNYAFDIGNGGDDQLINNKYALWAYDHDKKFLKEFEIRIKNKWVNGVDMKINPEHQLVLSGYFNESKNPTINGVFTMKINKNLKLLNSSWHKFESATLDKFLKNENNKKTKELEDYKMDELLVMDDGSFYILGEQYYKYVERSYDPRTNITTTTEHYNYNSIIVSHFDSIGMHQWTDRIPKSQNSTNDYGYFSSFTTMNSGSDIYLFFNDSRKNNESPPDGYFEYNNLFNNKRFQVSYVQVGTKGIKARGGLLDEKYNYLLRAKLCSQLTTKSMYLITESSRNSKIVRVELKK